MTEVYFFPGFPEVFRVVPSHPEYAVSEGGRLFDLKENKMRFGVGGSNIISWQKQETNHVYAVVVDVDVLIAEAFDHAEENARADAINARNTSIPPRPHSRPKTAVLPGPKLEVYNHGDGDHISSPSCSKCYLGFDATPEELRQMLWWMSIQFAEEVDATAAELVDQIREQVTDFNKEDGN